MQATTHLESRINQIYDHLYANAPVRTPAGIAREVGKILRTIAFVERNTESQSLVLDFSPLSKNKFDKRDQEIIVSIANKIRDSFRLMNSQHKLYPSEEELLLSNLDIAYVCGKLDGVHMSTNQRDVFGDAMEIFRSHWTKSNGGQFFTDQRVTRLAIKLLQFNPLKDDDLVDICAGTGGFLLAGINHIKNLVENDETKIPEVALKYLKGQEIDKELCSIGNATLASQLGLLKAEIINKGNSILPTAFTQPSNKTINFNIHKCAATNPPFGTKITIKDFDILKHFDLARVSLRPSLFGDEVRVSHRALDILFIEQNVKLLEPGFGRLAIVVPYQIVSGPQTLSVRNWLLRHTQILAVVDLPAETFQPHTGTKASLLIVKRREKSLDYVDISKDERIFMSTPKWIGHDRRGNPTYKRAIDGSFTDEILSDFPDVEKAFEHFITGKDPAEKHRESFAIEASQIVQRPELRLDARFYRGFKSTLAKSAEQKLSNGNGEWELVKLQDVVSRIFYPGRFSRNYVRDEVDSVPFLGGTNISQLLLITEKQISIHSPRIKELQVKPGWILVTRSGSVGIVSSVPSAWDGYALSEHVIRIIPNPKRLAPEYLYAFLKTKYAQDIMARGVYGSVIDEITPEYIANMDIPIPKNRKLLSKIVNTIKKGEKARQDAIEFLTRGVQDIEKELIK